MATAENMIADSFHKRAANEPHWDYKSPKALRVNPQDMDDFFTEAAEEREKRAGDYEPWFPEAAARERAEARAMVGIKVARWIDPYCGQSVEVIYDDAVTPGTIVIVEADGEG